MAPPLPLEIVMLLERQVERELFLHEARALELRLYATDDPSEVLSYVIHRDPDAVVLPIGAREEESILLCRSIRKRVRKSLLPIVLVSYGGSLVENASEAREMGADRLIPEQPPGQLLKEVREIVDLPVEMEINDEEIIDMAWSADGLEVGADPEAGPDFSPGAGMIVISSVVDPRLELRQRLETLYEQLRAIREEDYFTILGLPLDASVEAIQIAFRERLRAFADEAWPAARFGSLEAELTEIREGLIDAYHVLGNVFLRTRYRAALRGSTT